MTDRYIQFMKKTAGLPEVFRLFCDSEASAEANRRLAEKHQVFSADELTEIFIDFVNSDFDFALLMQRLQAQADKAKTEDANRLAADYLGEIFLPLQEYLPNLPIKNEILKHQGNLKDYEEAEKEFEYFLEEQNNLFLEEIIKDHESQLDEKQERAAIFDLFDKDLANILRFGTAEAIGCVNTGLIFLLNTSQTFKYEIMKKLAESNLIITGKNLKLKDGPKPPSIKYWLKNFIDLNGEEMFNNVTISKYLTSTENTVNLPPEEKQVLKKLLILYRNIRYYPESLYDTPIEKWEIIPISKQDGIARGGARLQAPKTQSEREIEKLQAEESQLPENSLERLAVDEEIEKQKHLEELQYQATKFPAGSLERSAIEDEIERLKQ